MLAARNRVTSGSDYRRIVRGGTRIRCSGVTLHLLETAPLSPPRFGFIITKMIGKAHERNALRRKLKAVSARLIADGMCGFDVIVRPHQDVVAMDFSELFAAIVKPLTERGLISKVTQK